MTRRIRPESFLPKQEIVSNHVADVHENMAAGRTDLAQVALDAVLKAGSRIDYSAIGDTDSELHSRQQSLDESVDALTDEHERKRWWLVAQHGKNATPELIKRLSAAQKRMETITQRDIPKAKNSLKRFSLDIEEFDAIAEQTGEAWPYYRELSYHLNALEPVSTATDREVSTNDIRLKIHNIISQLSYDRSGELGVRYDAFTAYLFNAVGEAEKSMIAREIIFMIADGQIHKWQDGSTHYIRSMNLVPRSEKESEAKLVTVRMDVANQMTEKLIKAIHDTFGTNGYRRVETSEHIEIQVPRVFLQSFASMNGLLLARDGPASFKLHSS